LARCLYDIGLAGMRDGRRASSAEHLNKIWDDRGIQARYERSEINRRPNSPNDEGAEQ
jgi:hypothetical protein